MQIKVLEEAARVHPDTWWWVKTDGCDIVAGLKEAVNHEWSGDVDLNDGKVAKLHAEYMARRKFIEDVGITCRRTRALLLSDLHKLGKDLKNDVIYLSSSKLTNIMSVHTLM